MKKYLLIFVIFTLYILNANAFTPVEKWGQLQVKGTQLCDKNGNAVSLRGVSLGWHNMWPRFYNKNVINWLADDWHVTVVRASMGIQIKDNYLENPKFSLDCIESVIKACINKGVYVIIDWHAHKTHKTEAVDFFGKMAMKYGNYPNVIYEIFNEPTEQSWDSIKDYATDCINEIRKYDSENIILVGCPHWDQDIHLVADSPLKGFTNIMYTVHFYAATHKQELRDRTINAIHRGIPVFVSECGASEADGNGKLDETEWNNWIVMLEANKISWINWSISDKEETCSMLYPTASSNGNWTEDDMRFSGHISKQTLLKYNK